MSFPRQPDPGSPTEAEARRLQYTDFIEESIRQIGLLIGAMQNTKDPDTEELIQILEIYKQLVKNLKNMNVDPDKLVFDDMLEHVEKSSRQLSMLDESNLYVIRYKEKMNVIALQIELSSLFETMLYNSREKQKTANHDRTKRQHQDAQLYLQNLLENIAKVQTHDYTHALEQLIKLVQGTMNLFMDIEGVWIERRAFRDIFKSIIEQMEAVSNVLKSMDATLTHIYVSNNTELETLYESILTLKQQLTQTRLAKIVSDDYLEAMKFPLSKTANLATLQAAQNVNMKYTPQELVNIIVSRTQAILEEAVNSEASRVNDLRELYLIMIQIYYTDVSADEKLAAMLVELVKTHNLLVEKNRSSFGGFVPSSSANVLKDLIHIVDASQGSHLIIPLETDSAEVLGFNFVNEWVTMFVQPALSTEPASTPRQVDHGEEETQLCENIRVNVDAYTKIVKTRKDDFLSLQNNLKNILDSNQSPSKKLYDMLAKLIEVHVDLYMKNKQSFGRFFESKSATELKRIIDNVGKQLNPNEALIITTEQPYNVQFNPNHPLVRAHQLRQLDKR